MSANRFDEKFHDMPPWQFALCLCIAILCGVVIGYLLVKP